jgi:glycosyltransferase involved in cell wall biosynthesis
MTKKIGILVVAYNAASTLHQVLDRIPPDFAARVDRVLVCDDASDDATYLVGLGYQTQTDLPLTVIRHARNLGYGGNQKAGYRWAIENDLDIIVLLHGDGQYAPELLPSMVAPLESGECDAVLGSRMMEPGRARRGGMPLYKYVGNRILTRAQNALVGTDLSEWHSGYRAYTVDALREIPFERNSDGFDFDTEIIIQLHEAEKALVEIPIPTYYGDEICHVNGLGYARDVTVDSLRYRLHRMGFGTGEMAFAHDDYQMKLHDDSSHGRILEWMSNRPPGRVLDLGCATGRLGQALRLEGHHVVGVDAEKPEGVAERLDEFHQADLDQGIPSEIVGPFDVIVAADVLEHLRRPEEILDDARRLLAPRGVVVVSVPNFGHWYPRARVMAGRFDYDRRGILDETHLRFFTRHSFERLVASCGYRIRRRDATGLPLEVAERGARAGSSPRTAGAGDLIRKLDRTAVAAWPTLFGYQFVYELELV